MAPHGRNEERVPGDRPVAAPTRGAGGSHSPDANNLVQDVGWISALGWRHDPGQDDSAFPPDARSQMQVAEDHHSISVLGNRT